MNTLSLRIGWLYPDLMSTYGDRGNIISLQKRCEWRSIEVEVVQISVSNSSKLISSCDLLVMGGAQDTQQEIVQKDLLSGKAQEIKNSVEKGIPSLFICGAYQFMGAYYKTSDGTILNGLSIFDIYTEHPGENVFRLIGNVAVSIALANSTDQLIVGFENHGGRTYLGKTAIPFGKVIKGYGNNGTDKTEGVRYKNSVGTYLHGPILPKNPELSDEFILNALKVKYKREIKLVKLNNSVEMEAKKIVLYQKLGIKSEGVKTLT